MIPSTRVRSAGRIKVEALQISEVDVLENSLGLPLLNSSSIESILILFFYNSLLPGVLEIIRFIQYA